MIVTVGVGVWDWANMFCRGGSAAAPVAVLAAAL